VNQTLAKLAAVLALVYLASGLYVVKGNEQALVRRFGKARLPLVGSGLRYDLPWPFAQIDRVNLHEVRTISIGIPVGDAAPQVSLRGDAGLIKETGLDRQAEFLTGDKNILNLHVNVPYQIVDPYLFAFGSESPETGLKLLAESVVTDVIARSGVDFVHPLGLHELREVLTKTLREAAERQQWGIAVEDATIVGVFPPVEVKASFLDVSNARAEKDRIINEQHTQAEKLLADARAAARQRHDQAETERHTRVEAARGSADRFLRIVAQFKQESRTGGQSYESARRMALQRMYIATLEEILPKLSRKTILDSEKPIDFTVFPPAEKAPEKPAPARNK
jgi:membrane protease subunit HflK